MKEFWRCEFVKSPINKFNWAFGRRRQHRTVQRLGTLTDKSAMLTGDCGIRMIPDGSYSSAVCDIPSKAGFKTGDAQSKWITFRVI